jgi:hypothetical protein
MYILMLYTAISRGTLLAAAAVPCIASALRMQLHQPNSSTSFRSRELVTLEGCPEYKEFATPYNEDSSGYLFSGM